MSEERFREVFRRITSETPDAPAFSDLSTLEAGPLAKTWKRPWVMATGAAAIVLIVIGGFGLLGGGGSDLASPSLSTTTTPEAQDLIPADCPVTIPTEEFVPPDTHPQTPSGSPGMVWYGTNGLWTSLSRTGDYQPRKSVWWSAAFPGGGEEPEPALAVTFELMNSEIPFVISSDRSTNAQTAEDGWFIIADGDPEIGGCWRATAIYKGASLSYVYYNPYFDDHETNVPDVVGETVSQARNILESHGYVAAFHDSSNLTYEVCAQEPGAGVKIDTGAIIGMRTAAPGGCEELLNPAPIVVPDVVGLTVDLAVLRLRIAGLVSSFAGPFESGHVVCRQEPRSATEMRAAEYVTLETFLPGGCDEFLKPNGLYNRTYSDEEGRYWYGTDCPGADVLIRGGSQVAGHLPRSGDTFQERIHGLLQDNAVEFSELGAKSLAVLPRIGEVWQFAENGDVVVVEWEDDYMIKVTKDESFACPSSPYSWNGIPVAFMNS